MPGKIITFYAFKGGTGRTMALANAGVILARNARVLAIDWDLEAPGLSPFLGDGHDSAERPGLVDLFTDLNDRLKDTGSVERAWADVSLSAYTAATAIDRLSLMSAGRMDADYATKVNSFDWAGLYEQHPDALTAFAQQLGELYDYILIDSRTGITDTSGICTTLLPELLVVVFTPNQQSLAGGVDRVRAATDYRHRSDDLRPLTVYPLASRVEISEEDLRREWRYGSDETVHVNARVAGYQPTFERLFEDVYDLPRCDLDTYFDEIQIQHVPRFSYGERVAVLVESSKDRLSAARSYESFTAALLAGDPPWMLARPKRSFGDKVEAERRVLETVEQQRFMLEDRVQELDASGRNLRLVQLIAGAIGAIGLTLILLGSTSVLSVPLATVGLVMAAAVQFVLRLGPWRHRGVIAAGATRLASEERLYAAQGGGYRGNDAPATLLAERAEDITVQVAERTSDGGMSLLRSRD